MEFLVTLHHYPVGNGAFFIHWAFWDSWNTVCTCTATGCYGSLGPFLTKISRTLTIISRTFEIDQYLSDLDHYLSDLSNWPKSLGPIAKISRSLLANISRTISKKVSRTSYDIFFHFVTKPSPRRAQKGKLIYFLSDCVPKSVRTP